MLRTKRPSFAAVFVANQYEAWGRYAGLRVTNDASCNWVDLFSSVHVL